MAHPAAAPVHRPAATAHRPLLVAVAAVTAANVTSNLVLPDAAYIPFALAVAAGLTVFAVRVDGRSAHELGWARNRLGPGVAWGAATAAGVALVYAVGASLAATRPLFEDARVEDLDAAGVAFQALLRVPLGTVALEEVAFRSVLLAMLLARTSPVRAVAISSILFGLWHVLPVLGMGPVNPVQDDHLGGPGGTAIALAGAVAGTTVAGVVFCFLRIRAGSLMTPMMLHWATNGLGYLVAWRVLTGEG